MIIEYLTSEGVVHRDGHSSTTFVIIPRINEAVIIAGKKYNVRDVTHEIYHNYMEGKFTYKTHKVSVELI